MESSSLTADGVGTDCSRKIRTEDKIRSVVGDVVGKWRQRFHYRRQYQAYILAVINALTQLSQQYDLRINDMFGVQTDYFEILTKVEKTKISGSISPKSLSR